MSKTKTRFRPDSERLRATLSGGVGLCLAVALCALAACGGLADAADGNGEQTCEKMKEIGMLECLNGGHLYSARNTSRLSCSRCECPDEEKWTGIDCSLCRSKDHCPVGPGGKEATGCTFGGNVEPTVEELEQPRGKILSCSCGGDPQSEQYCKMQPNTFAMISMKKAGNDGNLFERDSLGLASAADLPEFEMQITEFAGSPDPVPGKPRYKYAFPVVWNATLTSCKHSVGPCYGPLKAPECDLIQCGGALVRCPPPGVPKCPGWDPVGDCGPVPNDPNHTNYWQFHCIPMSIPVNSSGTLYCERGGGGNGTLGESRCYFYQAKSLFGQGIAIKCQTGNCVYNSTSPTPDPKPGPHGGSYHVPALIATNVLFALVLGVFIFSAGFFVFKETQKWQLEEGFVMLPGAERRVPLEFRDVFADGGGQEFYLEWKVESYCVPMQHLEKRILRNVSGFVCAAKPDSSSEGMVTNVFAILGPSGAGKTTLLDILAGRNTTGSVTGDIRVNGKPVTPATMTQIAGYAPQSDILPGTSTVWEYLLFHANLRLPPTTTPTETKVRVRDIVLQLGLMKVVDSFIGDEYTRGISGGEKKRVSVASELLHRPSILFLDEPTTGLDSTNAATMVEALASLGAQGMIVVLSIHQPRSDIFRLMDRVLVLSCHGEMVYSGQTRTLEVFLKSLPYVPRVPDDLTLADFMLDLVIKSGDNIVSSLVNDFRDKRPFYWKRRDSLDEGGELEVNAKHKSSFGTQLKALSIRLLRNMYRHPFLVFLNLICTMLFSIMIGVSYWHVGTDTSGIQNRMGCLFFVLMYLALMSLSSIPIWRDQHVLFVRERASLVYGTPAYYTAVMLFDILPMRVFPPCFFGFFTYWMVGLHKDCTFCLAYFLVILVLSNVASALMSMAIGAASPSNRVANYIGSLAILILSLFGSFLMNRGDLPAGCRWIANLSFLQYAYEALVVNEFHDSRTTFTLKVPIDTLPPLTVNGDGVLKQFQFNVEGKNSDIMSLLLLSILHGILGFLFLRWSGKNIFKGMRRTYYLATKSCRQAMRKHSYGQTLLSFSETSSEVGNGRNEGNSDAFFPFHFMHKRNISQVSSEAASDMGSPLISERSSEDDFEDQLCLTWLKISKTIAKTSSLRGTVRLSILDNVSGVSGLGTRCARNDTSGLFAILGPSGAGKTTLLDILAGRNTTGSVTGDIRVNGKPVTPATMTQIAGYAPQSDILPGTSTVWEYLLFHANLRLPPTTTPTETKVRVRDIVLQLGLMKVVDSFIGDEYTRGISGGEKKRVSVASELLHRPSILFLDEPTTGLDSTNAATMVEALASLAEKGINVILSIQQPRSDIFRLMERVLVLSSDGEMMYSGPARMLLGFLGGIPGLPAKKEKENTADYILDVIIKSGDYALQTIITAYQNSAAVEEENRLLNTIYVNSSSTRVAKAEKSTVGYGKQVKELSKRLLKNTMRQPFLVYLNFVSTCLVALMLGLVFFKTSVDFGGIQNRMGSMFFIVLYLGLASLSSVPVWNENRLLFLRERASGAYSTFAYFTSMVLFDILPMRIIPTCMFSLSYFMIGLSSTTDAILHFPTFLVILILANAASVSMSMCIGACFPDTKVANAFASLAVLVSIMYSGFILSRHTMGGFAKAGTDFSYMNFAFEALLINEFHGAKGYYFNSYADSRLRVNVTGDEVLDLFDFNANNLLLDISALFMIGFFFFTMCFLLLLRDR
ncbi:pleiotropic drug resistance-like ABC transporter [Chloropicon primus]|uniref:Pleiotropic drug resistance-like ABC transporter n=1 Tax=Chloropicon primus TaxID=1764295 RepID=A0A5B8MJI3_9CHLO|nr:pleiotropic drug resistance-like ABC transporter [Chloropicon primus]UPQ99798.1 pleiotropic drug resistance-like ABC transporter [Chloropicon primus]|eukprot:QDZ20587.1 pleiotropic drug resistance-like ABC transporter [Chloropicon primus]